ncbi:MAG TPA: hypothetical protein VGI82_14435 [Chitinophagaceae bacterium]
MILCPAPRGTAATQRLKYEQYLDLLEKEGFQFTISPFQSRRFWKIIYKPGHVPEKIFWTCVGYLRRIFDLFRSPFYDAVFVNLWVTPLGFPTFERALFFFNSSVIYDIDDMIFAKTGSSGLVQKMKGRNKPLVLMKHAKAVITCTPKLLEIALDVNKFKHAVDISSTFDTNRFIPVKEYCDHDLISVGWTGTHSTLPFLETLQPVLAELSKIRKIKLIVIANKEYQMREVETEFIFWKEQTEVKDLHRIEIGLYPIPANEWSLGKSSLKALTYMAIAIPFVATAYGTNYRIMENGKQGFLALTDEEWLEALIKLTDSAELRRQMGLEGRKRVEEMFSLKINFPKYLQIFKTAVST